MKVLKLGKEIKQECPSCKSLLLINDQDWESPKGSGFNKTYARCPICGGLIYQDWILGQYNNERASDSNTQHSRELILEKKHAEGIDGAWDDPEEGWHNR